MKRTKEQENAIIERIKLIMKEKELQKQLAEIQIFAKIILVCILLAAYLLEKVFIF